MADKKDYYQVLGVDKNSTDDEIKKAYRKLARQYHPDLNRENPPKALAMMMEINEAYDVLKNKDKRAQYDQFGFLFSDSARSLKRRINNWNRNVIPTL